MQQFEPKEFLNRQELYEYENRKDYALSSDTEDNFYCVLDKEQKFEVILDLKRGDDS